MITVGVTLSIALYTEGIFRLSGNAKRIATLQMIFDTRGDDYGLHLNWDDYTVHDASNVMRRFLNYLPEPLISLHYQALFKTALGTTLIVILISTLKLTLLLYENRCRIS